MTEVFEKRSFGPLVKQAVLIFSAGLWDEIESNEATTSGAMRCFESDIYQFAEPDETGRSLKEFVPMTLWQYIYEKNELGSVEETRFSDFSL